MMIWCILLVVYVELFWCCVSYVDLECSFRLFGIDDFVLYEEVMLWGFVCWVCFLMIFDGVDFVWLNGVVDYGMFEVIWW